MEQFSNFTFVKQISVEKLKGKFNMNYRLKTLMEEKIDLTTYGETVQPISFSPLIGEVFPPISEYIPCCPGGANAAGTCGSCGSALVHNTAYHN
jgi:hypothetical protein